MASFMDPTGRGPSTATLFVRGTIYLSIVALVAVLLLMQAGGAFHRFVDATAVVSSVGDGLDPGADVKLRGVLVGKVGEIDSEPGGAQHVIQLHLELEHAVGIPASVRARIIPTNIFGQPSVELVAGTDDRTPLRPDAVIPGDDSQAALQLQTAISNLQRLITTVEPSKLNATLSSIKQALHGRGEQIGGMIDRLDRYLGKLNPQSERFGRLLHTAGTALQGLEASAPDLLDTVDGLLPTTRTVVDKRREFVATLTGADALLGTVDGFVDRNSERIITVLHGSKSVVAALAADADAVPRSFRALAKGAKALVSVFDDDSGRLGIGLTFSLSPYDPYTAADCPRYPGLDGPNCGQATSAEPAEAGPVGREQERRQLQEIFGDEVGGSSVAGLLLGPILRGTTVVLPR